MAFVLLLFLAGLVAVQSPRVQTALGQRAVAMLESKMDANIRFSSISIRPFDAIMLEDLALEDQEPVVPGMDTILYAERLSAKFSLAGLLAGNGVRVKRLKIENGFFNLAIENDSLSGSGSNVNIERVFRIHPSGNSEPLTWGNLVSARSVDISHFHFWMSNPRSAARMAAQGRSYGGDGSMDWNDLKITVNQIRFSGVKVADDFVTGTVTRLDAFDDDTGFYLQNLSARHVQVGRATVRIDDLQLREHDTQLYVKHLDMLGSLDDYDYFEDKVRLDVTLMEGSRLSMQTISHLSSGLEDITFKGKLQGRVEGYVCDLHLDQLRIEDLEHQVKLQVDGRILGLPDEQNSILDLRLQDLSFGLDDLGGFVEAWAPETGLDLGDLAPGDVFHYKGRLSGPLNRMLVAGDLSAPGRGLAVTGLTIRNAVDSRRPIIIDGKLETRDLDLGHILNIQELGPLSMKTGLAATFGKDGPDVRIDSLKISRLNAMGYDYSDISAVGTYREDAFDGRITAADPNLSFLFQGTFNLSKNTQNAAYQFYASLGYADLHALHIDNRERSKLSFQASSNFIRTEARDLLGDISLTDILLESETGVHNIGDIVVRAHANDDVHRIRLDSRFMEASFVGDRSLPHFLSDIQDLLVQKELPALLPEAPEPWDGSSYEVSLQVYDARDLLNFLMPGLYVENRTEAHLTVQEDGQVQATLRSGRLALGSRYIKDVQLNLNNLDQGLSAEFTGANLSLGDMQLQDNRITLFAQDNHLGLGYTFDNGEDSDTHAELYLSGELDRDPLGLKVSANVLPSNIYYNNNGWGLSSDEIRYHAGRVKVNRLFARHEDETLLVDGGYSPDSADTLSVRMEKFNLAFLNTITGNQPPLEGVATGEAVIISSSAATPGLLANLQCDSTRISGYPMGRLKIASVWDEAHKRFNVHINNNLKARRNLDIDGYLVPATSTLHASALFQDLELGYAKSFMEGLFTEFSGQLNGQVVVDGKLDKLHLSSKYLRIDKGRIELDYARVPYDLEGSLTLNDKGLFFDQVTLSDGEKGSGTVSGGILMNGFRNVSLDTHVKLEKMHVLDLAKGVNPTLFGSVYASGRADVTGPLNKIFLDINAVSAGPGELHLPLDSVSSDSDRQMLTFKESLDNRDIDPYEEMMAARQEIHTQSSDLRVKLRVQVQPEVRAFIDIDENSLNGVGSGIIELESRPSQDIFTLGGDYTLSDGSFHFSAMNLVKRDFTIQDGSTVRFNGDVWDTDLNVKGLYITKASLSNLIASDAALTRRTVNCGINITGKMRNPELKFTIDVPDLNPSIQAQVDGALNTEDKVQKQFLYLLIAGAFLPTEESGITSNGSEVLYSNVSSIMSGQLNNIFQKLNIPLDLGLNYQSTNTGSNIFDVALSTQLFNNRVVVNGTVGNKQIVGNSSNEVIGDLDIEIKLNRSGSLRLNLFSHSADQLTSYLDNSQRNGAGITYQREFNSFRNFFRELFESREKREQRIIDQALSAVPNKVWQVDTLGKLQANEQQ